MSDPIIRFRNVHKRFGDLVVLDGIDLDIPRGKTTAIIGPSGTGKSVLIKHIVGLLQPDSGSVYVEDVDMATATEPQKYEVRKKLGMLFQDGALFDSLTTGENVEFPLKYHTKLTAHERREIAESKLATVELPGLYERPTSKLSGGQRKRVGLARAIVMEPEVILFDEPNSGLDPMTSDTIDELIGRMKEQLGITFIVITHDIVSCLRIADHVAMLYDGKLVANGSVGDLKANTHPVVQRFLRRHLSGGPA